MSYFAFERRAGQLQGTARAAEEKMTLGQASRLMGISQVELEEAVRRLKEKLGRSKITNLELQKASGLNYQQIWRCRGWLYREFGIEIISEREKAGAIAEAERIERDKTKLKELTSQLVEQGRATGKDFAKIIEEFAPCRREQIEIQKSEGVSYCPDSPEEKHDRWCELEDHIWAVWKKHNLDVTERNLMRETGYEIIELRRQLASST